MFKNFLLKLIIVSLFVLVSQPLWAGSEGHENTSEVQESAAPCRQGWLDDWQRFIENKKVQWKEKWHKQALMRTEAAQQKQILQEWKARQKASKKLIREKIWQKRIEIRNLLNGSLTPSSVKVRDELAEYYFDNVVSKNASKKHDFPIFLAIGNGDSQFSGPEQKQIHDLASKLYHYGYLVVYDADSAITPIIKKAVPKGRRLGISGNHSHESSGTLVIDNPYTRMMSILSIHEILISPDSVTGMGLFIKGMNQRKNRFKVLDLNDQWVNSGLSQWVSHLDSGSVVEVIEEVRCPRSVKNLGIRYPSDQEPKVYNGSSSIVFSLNNYAHYWYEYASYGIDSFIPSADLGAILSEIHPDRFEEIIQNGNTFAKSFTLLDNFFKGGRAVVFGSTLKNSTYEDLVRRTVEVITQAQLSIITSGGGGLLEVANQVTHDQKHIQKNPNVVSIGIPIENPSWSLPLEEAPARHCHDLTLPAEGYTQQIPLLFQNQKLFVFTPGGENTLRELAALLIKIGSKNETEAPLVFVGRHYYTGLVSWLKKLNLPEKFKDKIHLVNSAEEMQEIVDQQAIYDNSDSS